LYVLLKHTQVVRFTKPNFIVQMKNGRICLRFFLIGVFTIGLLGTNTAFGASPTIIAYVANDPDDADTVFGAGDTITISTDIATNATLGNVIDEAFVTANFTFASPDPLAGLTFTTDWTANWISSTSLEITFININNVLTITTSTVDTSAGNTIGDQTADDVGMTNGAPDPLTGDFGLFVAVTTRNGGSGSCLGDCSPPTLGIDEKYSRIVENGFTYNGDTINVERFFTPYPLITVDVGKQNYAVFKIFDNLGPDNIRHFDMAFGLDTGQILGTSNTIISWDKSHDGTETISIVDPHNVLDNVRVITSEGSCRDGSTTNDCLIVTVYHTFRESLESNMLATNVWDQRRNAWQNFYNHGIQIEGESLNPPDEYVGIYKGDLIHIIETGKNTAVDENGNTWTFDKIWTMDYIPKGKIVDGITKHGIDRNNAWFNEYKQGQVLLASSYFEKHYKSSISQEPAFSEIDDIFFYEFPDTIDKKFDPVLQAEMHEEDIRAQKYLEELFAKIYPHLVSAEYPN